MKLLANARLYSVEAMFPAPGTPFTRQRQAIFDFFAAADHAVPIAEAVQALRPAGIGESTVHRTVALLAELGLLQRVNTGGGEQCLVATPVGHYHPLICGVCRKVVDIDGEGDLIVQQAEIEATTGFRIYGHHLEIYGVCPECLAAKGGGRGDRLDADVSLREV